MNTRTVLACVAMSLWWTTNVQADEPPASDPPSSTSSSSPPATEPPPPQQSTTPTDGKQERPERLNAVQLDLGLAVVGLAYERVFARRFATQIEAHIFGTWFGPIVDLPRFAGFGGQIRPSIFLTDDGPRGVYVAPYFRLNRVTGEASSGSGATGKAIGWSTGAFVGYSFLFRDRVNLRLGAGLQYMHYIVNVEGERLAFKTLFPAFDIVVGVVF